MRLTVATYNIHKGFSHFNRRVVIHDLRQRLEGLDADLVFLQEVVGVHERHAGRFTDWPRKPQHEYIAGERWTELAYGKNAVYRDGHHGNALLSRFPIVAQDNEDISAHPFESRGLLHCVVGLGKGEPELHCLNVHLGLFERGREWQVRALCERIRATVPDDAPLLIARLSTAVARWIVDAHGGDRRKAQAAALARVGAALGAAPGPGWTTAERAAYRSLALLVGLVDDLDRWSAADKAACVALMRAKGAPDDAPFFAALARHPRLPAALARIADAAATGG